MLSWFLGDGTKQATDKVIVRGSLYDSYRVSRCLLLKCTLCFDRDKLSFRITSNSSIPETVTEYNFDVSVEMRLQRSMESPPRLRWYSVVDSQTIPPFIFLFDKDQNPLVDDLQIAVVEAAQRLHPEDKDLDKYWTTVNSFEEEDNLVKSGEKAEDIDLGDAKLLFSDENTSFYTFNDTTETFKPFKEGVSLQIYERALSEELKQRQESVVKYLLCLIVEDHPYTQIISHELLASIYPATNSIVWHIESGHMVSVVLSSKNSFDVFKEVFVHCLVNPYFKMGRDVNMGDTEWLGQSMMVDEAFESGADEYESDDTSSLYSFVDDSEPESKDFFDGDVSIGNSLLDVGASTNDAFVIRGSKLGVFSVDHNDIKAKGMSAIKNPKTKGDMLPSQMLVHDRDSSLILLANDSADSMYKMDLNRGEVVEEWKSSKDDFGSNSVVSIAPQTKYGASEGEKTFVGINGKAVMQFDTRLPKKSKLANMVSYNTNQGLNCIAATENGEYAVGTEFGEVKLFRHTLMNSKVGKARAMTNLPGFGEKMRHIDVTKNGKWVLCTYKTYLMLINTQSPTGGTGFQKRIKDDDKKAPIRLTLRVRDVRKIGGMIDFTPARFNYSTVSNEVAIVTSTGRFLIIWDFELLKKKGTAKYRIEENDEKIIRSNFLKDKADNLITVTEHTVAARTSRL